MTQGVLCEVEAITRLKRHSAPFGESSKYAYRVMKLSVNSVFLCVFTPCDSVVKNKQLNHRDSQSYQQSFTEKSYPICFLDSLMTLCGEGK